MRRKTTKNLMKVLAATLVSVAGFAGGAQAQAGQNAKTSFSARQQSIIKIAAFTAVGNLDKLSGALTEGLDSGLSINEITEILAQMYAYSGFPRSLNGINTFMEVLKEREAAGIKDPTGPEASRLPTDKTKYELGKETLAALSGDPTAATQAPFALFAPVVDTFLKEHLFADIFGRGVLSYLDREIATVAALSAIGNVNSQLQSHLNMSMNVGMSPTQARELVTLIRTEVGRKQGKNAQAVLNKVLEAKN